MKKSKGENSAINNFLKILILFVGVVLQLFLLLFLYGATSKFADYARVSFQLIQFISVIYIVYKNQNYAYKIIWIILLMFLPVAGLVAYLLWGNNKTPKAIKKKLLSEKRVFSCDNVYSSIGNSDRLKEAKFLVNSTNYPIYHNDNVDYFENGECCYEKFKKDLRSAKKYILIEFFIISKGKMWDEIYEILKEKSEQNVEIYLIYDSLGSLLKKPHNLKKQLDDINVKYLSFNPLTPLIRSYINYRDHRKIVVIDGLIAYTGGINIGDEYINLNSRLGHWKDCFVRVTGECVKSFIMIFFENWNISKSKVNYKKMIDDIDSCSSTNGFVIPFSDSPLNKKNPSENIYINVINNAKKYVYIMTPYLILDSEMQQALINSSIAGVDIRIITPYIPDKKLVNACTKSFYGRLLDVGIKIYEYKPGFIHSKVVLSDDNVAVIGTTNFDFRSFYLNYECGVWLHNTGKEFTIKKDFIDTIDKSLEIDIKAWKQRKLLTRIVEALLRLISPLL